MTIRPQEIVHLHAPSIDATDVESVRACLESGWVSTAGPYVGEFERATAEYVGVPYAVATVSGTSALHVALLSLGVGPGDEVLVPSLTFIATANAVRYCGAEPVFFDVDEESWGLNVAAVEAFLRQCRLSGRRLVNPRSGRRIAALLPMHTLGHPVDLDSLMALAAAFELPVIEDCAESLGATYRGRQTGSVGSCACLSFNGSKVITTGGGGMVLTANAAQADRIRHLTTQAKTSPLEYIHDCVGFNYRMPNINAALGLAQLARLPALVEQKRRIAARYRRGLEGIGLAFMPEASWVRSLFWLNTVLLPVGTTIDVRDRVLGRLNGEGIQARPFWRPAHLQAPYIGCEVFQVQRAADLYTRGVSLPSSPSLEDGEVDRVLDALRRACVGL